MLSAEATKPRIYAIKEFGGDLHEKPVPHTSAALLGRCHGRSGRCVLRQLTPVWRRPSCSQRPRSAVVSPAPTPARPPPCTYCLALVDRSLLNSKAHLVYRSRNRVVQRVAGRLRATHQLVTSQNPSIPNNLHQYCAPP